MGRRGLISSKGQHKVTDDPSLVKRLSGFRKYMRAFKPGGLEKSRTVINVLRKLVEKYHVTPSQVALSWIINFNWDIVVTIPGATKFEHAKDNTGSMKFMLTKDELDYLDTVSAPFKN